MFGAEIIVAAVFGEQQAVQKQRVSEVAAAAGFFAEERAAGAGQRALFHFAQSFEDFLPGLAQDDALADLKLGEAFAIFVRLLLAHVVVVLEQKAAAFQDLQELLVHFGADEFGDGKTRQKIDGQLEFFFGAVERSDLQAG